MSNNKRTKRSFMEWVWILLVTVLSFKVLSKILDLFK